MRMLFLLLVLANLLFFLWARYVSPPEATADPRPQARQIEPDKVKLVAPSEISNGAARPAVAVTAKCVEWGRFALTDLPRAEKALAPLALGTRLVQRRAQEAPGWWVFIAPQPTRASALSKAAELQALSVEDYFVLQDEGPLRWAISLGVFRTEDAALARLAALRSQGVRSAQIGMRDTVLPKVWLQVKGVDGPLYARLADIASSVEGTELRDCAQ
ncbi:MAG: hypothetical protein ABR570_07250 [Burkholderiales bacterium]